ncbi:MULTISPECIES: hypothetical protein [unclassified Mesorhizobium]|uniref:hypothetical protein n=1 Tax=unclassified Mesorhizobium TaxID=325217 RepID=UPI000FCCA08E|nr:MULTISPECIES: hypothetical protein [unclassified Mesorhizobium]RUX97430.1 hypothetical protein EN993_03775 [Mesorhizobium sp. M7D.F.Ca.US.004.01.2.1]RVA36616.1 hypothetical protein EN935_01585 [Mesorhizobium sp. M7D.F.Ca.US.004.03.1.1]
MRVWEAMGAWINQINPLTDRREQVSSWRPWHADETKRVQQNLARVVISKWERGEREDAERVAAGLNRAGKHRSNQPLLMLALATIYDYQDDDLDHMLAFEERRAFRLAIKNAKSRAERQAIKQARNAAKQVRAEAKIAADTLIAEHYNDLTDPHWRERIPAVKLDTNYKRLGKEGFKVWQRIGKGWRSPGDGRTVGATRFNGTFE